MKILLTGYGKMGKVLEGMIIKNSEDELMDIIDIQSVEKLKTLPRADVVIDFSNQSIMPDLCDYVKRTHTPLVSGTTALTEHDFILLKKTSQYAPVLHSSNYSIGIAVFNNLLRVITPILDEDFDIEVVEKHHNKKVDAPSGTANMLIDAMDPMHDKEVVYERRNSNERRKHDEIGMFSLRGGTLAGEHTVYFFGENETLEITHRASNRNIFARGALKAAKILSQKEWGFYTLEQVLFENRK